MKTGPAPAPARRKGRVQQPIPFAAGPLAPDEAAVLRELQGAERTLRRGQEIIGEGRRANAVFIVCDGVAIRYRILRDGQRQILNLVLPGDFAGVPGCFFENALYSVKALTETVVAPLPLARLAALFETHPRLAAKLFWSFACESAVYAEHLIAIGRRTAVERVAHFLLELLRRLQPLGLADERSYRLPLTQETIGDALGLSVPYVNRVLQLLRSDGLISTSDQLVTIEDIDELSNLADFEHTYLRPLSIAELMAERN